MSRFSGKCDVYDTLVIIHNYTDEELKNNVRIYMNGELLDIENRKDLIPYYPHLLVSSSFNNKKRISNVKITSYSNVDKEEKDWLEHCLKIMIRTRKYCIKKGIPFDSWDTLQKIPFAECDRNVFLEMFNRVDKIGRNANTDNLHLKCYEMYREELVDEMLKNGLNPSDFGYQRFLKKIF